MRFIPFVFFLTIIYLLLTTNLQWLNILVGVLISIGITLLTKPSIKESSLRRLPSAAFALIRYAGVLIYDIIKGGLMVARLALSPSIEIDPAIIAIPSGCESELATALSAHSISLSPGELVVEIDDQGMMYTHVLDISQGPEYKLQAQQLRSDLLQKIFQ
jgi:multicomponent Na+:H+ antiporter subunit E